MMRRISLVVVAAVMLSVSAPASAQEWIEYKSPTDFFGVNFLGQPKVKDLPYETEFGITLPARLYSIDNGSSHYSVTVVNYNDAEKIHTARSEECKKKGGEGDACQNDWRTDVQGSIVFASWKFLQRNAKVTHFGFSVVDQVSGQRLQLTNPDGSRTFAEIHLHGTRLYVLEATVPRGAPAPGLFQQSLIFLDEEGKTVRYRSIYTNGYTDPWKFPTPPPPHSAR